MCSSDLFWWRINAYSELAAMVVSFLVAVYFELAHPALFPAVPLSASFKLVTGVATTTVAWVAVTLLTRPTDEAVLRRFYSLVRPGGPGWAPVVRRAEADGVRLTGAGEPWGVPRGILAMFAGCFAVYSALFAVGYFIYGRYALAGVLTIVAALATAALARLWTVVSRGAPAPSAVGRVEA